MFIIQNLRMVLKLRLYVVYGSQNKTATLDLYDINKTVFS